jgi:uncharacterized protein YcsI (UPF0317 family)
MRGMSAFSHLDSVWRTRAAIRAGALTGHTSGLAPDFVQGNVVILPEEIAADFHAFCLNNPKPCPLLAVSKAGDPLLPSLGKDIDIRTDVPGYRIWQHGELVQETANLLSVWRSDLVTFVIGCSFSFEQALLNDGIKLRHIQEGKNVAMYRTTMPCVPTGPFAGPLVVSMRPLDPDSIARAIEITARYPDVHGAPVHIGDPRAIGIHDLAKPDYGDAVEVMPGELPVFWACGVTPQAALAHARPEFCITHVPGSMLITDLLNKQLARN